MLTFTKGLVQCLLGTKVSEGLLGPSGTTSIQLLPGVPQQWDKDAADCYCNTVHLP